MQAYLVDLVSNKKLVVVEPKCKIGRDEINDIVINGDLAVSRFHFLIIRENSQYFIDDCQSRHGTFLNGNQVQKREPINDGDVLKVGISLFWFVVESSIEDEEPKVPPVDMNQTISSLVENQKSVAEKPKEESSEPVKLFKSKLKDEDKVLASQEQVWKADDLLNVLTESLGQDILTEPLVNEDSNPRDLFTKEIDPDPKPEDLNETESTSKTNQADEGKLKSVLELVTGNDTAESAKSTQNIDEITIEENLKSADSPTDTDIEMDASAQDLINALNLEAASVDESGSSSAVSQEDELASLFKDLNDENSLENADSKAKEEAEAKAKEEAEAKAKEEAEAKAKEEAEAKAKEEAEAKAKEEAEAKAKEEAEAKAKEEAEAKAKEEAEAKAKEEAEAKAKEEAEAKAKEEAEAKAKEEAEAKAKEEAEAKAKEEAEAKAKEEAEAKAKEEAEAKAKEEAEAKAKEEAEAKAKEEAEAKAKEEAEAKAKEEAEAKAKEEAEAKAKEEAEAKAKEEAEAKAKEEAEAKAKEEAEAKAKEEAEAKAKEEAEAKAKEEAETKAKEEAETNISNFATPHLINQNIEFKAFSVTKDEFSMEHSSDININGVEKNMTTSKHVNGKEEMTSENSPIVESYLSKELARLDKVLADYNEQIKQINDKVTKVETRINLTKELRESLLTDNDEKLLVSCAKVLAMLGFDVKTSANDKQELRLHSKESADAVARVVWTPSKADRSDIGQLSMAQTRYWVESGIEPKGLLIVSKKIDEHSKITNEELFAELTDYAVKRNVCLLTTIQLLAMYKDVALGAGEPDTIKNTLLDTSGWLPGFEIATTTKSDAKIAVSEEESDKVSVN